jgi:Flp pilus assembly protein TadG
MRHKRKGQSLVEMALLLPFMFFILFAIIDFGWYIFNYSTVYNAARRAAEVASKLPPYESSRSNEGDACSGAITDAAREGFYQTYDNATGQWNPGLGGLSLTLGGNVDIRYPTKDDGTANTRQLGDAIEVQVKAMVEPLTPVSLLGQGFGLGSVGPDGNTVFEISSISRRTIEGLGINPEFKDGSTCQPTP